MKKVSQISLVLAVLVVALVLYTSSNAAYALTGPMGLNQIRTEAGPGAGQVTINWQRYNTDVTGYTIRYGTAPGKYQYGTDNIGNKATYTVKQLTPGVRYYFRLYPYRNWQLSDPASPEFSDVALATPKTVIGTSGPYGQRQLRAMQGPAKGQVTLSWLRLNPDVDTYHIIYGLQPGVYIYGAQNVGAANVNGYTINGLTSGVRYYFAVVPSRGGQALFDSAEVSQIAR